MSPHRLKERIPAEEPDTLRHQIELLLIDRSLGVRDISSEVGLSMKEVVGHLEHIQKSLAHTERGLDITPARCRKCGFEFKKRDRIRKPGKCPVCRGEYILEPLFSIRPRDRRRLREEGMMPPESGTDCNASPTETPDSRFYLMEGPEEAIRLDLKTDDAITERQALWAGIRPGMRVADIGCGAGKTTRKLQELVEPGGTSVGVDIAEQRIRYARQHYAGNNIRFVCRDGREHLDDLGPFDFIWMRFVLEYYRQGAFSFVENAARALKPGGTLCLIDLDYNCLSHYGLPDRLDKTIASIMALLERKADFDPYAGRRLYSFLYDLGFQDIRVDVGAHHLFYGPLGDSDAFNWMKKVEVAPKKAGYAFTEYDGGYEEFVEECEAFFLNPRRFTYTPVMLCRGIKP